MMRKKTTYDTPTKRVNSTRIRRPRIFFYFTFFGPIDGDKKKCYEIQNISQVSDSDTRQKKQKKLYSTNLVILFIFLKPSSRLIFTKKDY